MSQIESLDTTPVDEEIIIKLISNDGIEFTINKSYLIISNFLKAAIETDNDETEFNLEIKSTVLIHIVNYMKQYKGVEPIAPLPPLFKEYKEVVDEYCYTLTNTLCEQHILRDVMESVNYLDIPQLLHILGCKVASIIKGVPLDKIEEVIKTKC